MPASGTQTAHTLVGHTVKAVRRLRPGEVADLDRPELVTVIEFDDGSLLVGSQAEHFWGLGWLCAQNPKSKAWEIVEPPEEAA